MLGEEVQGSWEYTTRLKIFIDFGKNGVHKLEWDFGKDGYY